MLNFHSWVVYWCGSNCFSNGCYLQFNHIWIPQSYYLCFYLFHKLLCFGKCQLSALFLYSFLFSNETILNLLFNLAQIFGLVPMISLIELEAAGKHYCEDDWFTLKSQHHSVDDLDLLKYCFSSAYMAALLHDSLKIPLDKRRYAILARNVGSCFAILYACAHSTFIFGSKAKILFWQEILL